jgi:uncharacterized protein YcfJ
MKSKLIQWTIAGIAGIGVLSSSVNTFAAKEEPAKKQFLAQNKSRPAEKQVSAEVPEKSDKTPVSMGKYITGGIIGTTIGFGIGHGIQGNGRYASKGWIFTAGMSAGMLASISGAVECVATTNPNCSTFWAGTGVLLGFHIWEIVDVWTGATPVTSSSAYLLPAKDGGMQVGYAWNF